MYCRQSATGERERERGEGVGEREGGGTREEVGEREGRGRERVMVSALVIGRRGRGNESGMVENMKGERQREGREKGERLKSSVYVTTPIQTAGTINTVTLSLLTTPTKHQSHSQSAAYLLGLSWFFLVCWFLLGLGSILRWAMNTTGRPLNFFSSSLTSRP